MDEKDKRRLAESFGCRHKPLCDANAACTADLRDKKRYICVSNNCFEGNRSIGQGMRAFETYCHNLGVCLVSVVIIIFTRIIY